MGILESNQDSMEIVSRTLLERPLEPPKPKPKHSGWTTLPRAVSAGASEVVGNVSDVLGASAKAYAEYGMTQNPLEPMTDEQRNARNKAIEDFTPDFRPAQSRPLYDFSESMRVDPATATTAESLFFGLTKGLTKAVGGAVVAGPIGGAATLGVSEGMTQADELAQQGVDVETRTQVGALNAVLTGGSALIPVAGQTIKQTVALALAGGPAAYMAQQKATSEILSRANYPEIAQQYDPLDPVGLAIATLIPAGFGVHAMKSVSRATARQNAKADINAPEAAEVQPGAQDAQPAPVKTQNFEPQENVDVAMVQNLTIQRDIADSVIAKSQEDISLAAGKLTAQESRSLKQESSQLERSIQFEQARYDEAFKQLAKDSQATGLSRKQAEAAARQTLSDQATQMQSRYALVTGRPNNHLLAIQAEERLNRMSNGASPYEVYGASRLPVMAEAPVDLFNPEQIRFDQPGVTERIRDEARIAAAATNPEPKANPLEPAKQPQNQIVQQTIERIVTENPDMHVSVAEDGTRRTLKDDIEAVRKEIAKGTDDELGTDDAKLVQAAIQCFLGG